MRTLHAAWISPRCFRDSTARPDRGAAELQDRGELVRLHLAVNLTHMQRTGKKPGALADAGPQAFRIRTTRGGPLQAHPCTPP